MSPVTRWLKNLRWQDLGWINFKLAIGIVWPVVTILQSPPGLNITLQLAVRNLWLGMTALGACLCIAGIVMAAQEGTKWRPVGLTMELSGLIMMFTGPLVFLLVYLYLDTFTDTDIRSSWVVLPYAVCAAIAARGLQILPLFRSAARDDSKKG